MCDSLIVCCPSYVLDLWVTSSFPDSWTIEPQFLPFHYYDVVLLVIVLPLFVEVAQFLVQQPNKQLEILQAFLDIVEFPEPVLSSADLAQRILDLVVLKRLPRVVLQNSVLYVSRKLLISSPYFCFVFSVTRCSRRLSRAWFASWENRNNLSLCLWENRASASCSSCRTCTCTL